MNTKKIKKLEKREKKTLTKIIKKAIQWRLSYSYIKHLCYTDYNIYQTRCRDRQEFHIGLCEFPFGIIFDRDNGYYIQKRMGDGNALLTVEKDDQCNVAIESNPYQNTCMDLWKFTPIERCIYKIVKQKRAWFFLDQSYNDNAS